MKLKNFYIIAADIDVYATDEYILDHAAIAARILTTPEELLRVVEKECGKKTIEQYLEGGEENAGTEITEDLPF